MNTVRGSPALLVAATFSMASCRSGTAASGLTESASAAEWSALSVTKISPKMAIIGHLAPRTRSVPHEFLDRD